MIPILYDAGGGLRRPVALARAATGFGMTTTPVPNGLADRIDRLNAVVGQAVSWCALFIVLVQFAIVLMRYVLGIGSIWLQESVIYGNAALFLLAAAWTLRDGGHVRVDVFYAGAKPRTKATVDLAGAILLLLPFVIVLFVYALPYVMRSWSIFEGSRETSGLPFVYLLKTLILLFALTLGLQGVSQAIRAWHVLAAARAAKSRI
jgi:TRAP-type mannitol/chloroaromatic compound transport system permease small subunit